MTKIKDLANNSDNNINELGKIKTDISLPKDRNNSNKIKILDTIVDTDNPYYIAYKTENQFYGVGQAATQIEDPEHPGEFNWQSGSYISSDYIRYDWFEALYFEEQEITFDINGYEKSVTCEYCSDIGKYVYNLTPEDLAEIDPDYNETFSIKTQKVVYGRHLAWSNISTFYTYPQYSIPTPKSSIYLFDYKGSSPLINYSSGAYWIDKTITSADVGIPYFYFPTKLKKYQFQYTEYMDKWEEVETYYDDTTQVRLQTSLMAFLPGGYIRVITTGSSLFISAFGASGTISIYKGFSDLYSTYRNATARIDYDISGNIIAGGSIKLYKLYSLLHTETIITGSHSSVNIALGNNPDFQNWFTAQTDFQINGILIDEPILQQITVNYIKIPIISYTPGTLDDDTEVLLDD